ncbi:hypothetical protein H2201_002891 [Coniosporium apollinis]|uniref:MARVEL domain-containing protein n=1 Tax=Coniosporium apollinis TaxID=61459 RepID=A0ABQ9P180_9PEZI|nr:hypothetical protein H2201_002891 [Coniosporium apollinis]
MPHSSSSESSRRRLTLTLSTLALLTNTLTTLSLQYLPDEPYHLTRTSTLYASFAGVLSFLGLVGAIRRNSALVTIFANYLLVDAVVSTVPRLLILALLAELPGSFCRELEFGLPDAGERMFLGPDIGGDGTLGREVGRGLEEWLVEGWDIRRCAMAMGVVQLVVGAVLVGTVIAQWWCALRVRRYAADLTEREAMIERRLEESEKSDSVDRRVGHGEAPDVEKAGLLLKDR